MNAAERQKTHRKQTDKQTDSAIIMYVGLIIKPSDSILYNLYIIARIRVEKIFILEGVILRLAYTLININSPSFWPKSLPIRGMYAYVFPSRLKIKPCCSFTWLYLVAPSYIFYMIF